MPFKRKARLLFISPHGRFRAPVAAALANEIGADLCEARWTSPYAERRVEGMDGVVAAPQLALSQDSHADFTENALHWADTIFVLESHENEVDLALPAGAQLRRYRIPDCASAEECAAVMEIIETRIRGIVGGLRMFTC